MKCITGHWADNLWQCDAEIVQASVQTIFFSFLSAAGRGLDRQIAHRKAASQPLAVTCSDGSMKNFRGLNNTYLRLLLDKSQPHLYYRTLTKNSWGLQGFHLSGMGRGPRAPPRPIKGSAPWLEFIISNVILQRTTDVLKLIQINKNKFE